MKRVIKSKRLTEEQIQSLEGASVFDPVDLDDAIVEVRQTKGGAIAVYDYDMLCEKYFDDTEDGTYEHAQEYVDYNMVRALPYMSARAPIIGQVVRRIAMKDYGEELKALDREEYGEDAEFFVLGNAVYVRL